MDRRDVDNKLYTNIFSLILFSFKVRDLLKLSNTLVTLLDSSVQMAVTNGDQHLTHVGIGGLSEMDSLTCLPKL